MEISWCFEDTSTYRNFPIYRLFVVRRVGRLIRFAKELVGRTPAKSALTLEEVSSVICDSESMLNSKPLTYVTQTTGGLVPLTPVMFLIEKTCSGDCFKYS